MCSAVASWIKLQMLQKTDIIMSINVIYIFHKYFIKAAIFRLRSKGHWDDDYVNVKKTRTLTKRKTEQRITVAVTLSWYSWQFLALLKSQQNVYFIVVFWWWKININLFITQSLFECNLKAGASLLNSGADEVFR